jgi:5-methyltetrahydrofolate--homocysteine methyltransferase
MQSIVQQLQREGALVSDGAWGTLLQARGLRPGECPELWCVTHRDAVLEIPRQYLAAGADLVKTNSFGGTRYKLEFYGLAERAAELNAAAAAISREAAGPDRHVIASVGPTGKMLLLGDVSPDEVAAAFREQIAALARGGADAVCIETMSAIDEACLAIRAAREVAGLEILCTFTFERTAAGDYRTMMGVGPEEMVAAVKAAGADIVGANCSQGFAQMPDLIRRIKSAAATTPVIVHANAGLPHRINGADVFPETPEMVRREVPRLLAAGAEIIGGCCGTTPAHIAAIAEAVKPLRRAGKREGAQRKELA